MKGKHVLITGHTGFKGSWLTAMLHMQGAKVSGIALDPAVAGIFELAELHELLEHDFRQDIRDRDVLTRSLQKISPDVVIHLAAQPLVLDSYANPAETYETNVTGTLNVLQAVEATPSVQVTLIITTDKVYRQNPNENKAFIETDPLGAADPYSTSKAMADLLTQSWIESHPESKIAIARAGNVIGGGDVAENRLLPDLVKAFSNNRSGVVRNPNSVRPWQHVLDCLDGYIRLANQLPERDDLRGAFNFGPDLGDTFRVENVARESAYLWGLGAQIVLHNETGEHEAQFLALDSHKAVSGLGWRRRLTTPQAISLTIEWEKSVHCGENPRAITYKQIESFLKFSPRSSE